MSGGGAVRRECLSEVTTMVDAESDFDLICIGSGPAGQRGAVQAAKLRKRVAVVERRRCIGGVCIDTGTIPSKTFREAVVSLTSSSTERRRGERQRPTAKQLLE